MRLASSATATTLTMIATLHAVWGAGSSFPFRSREALADSVAGLREAPGPSECFGVAGLLLGAAGVVSGVLPIGVTARRFAATGVAAVLGARGVVGVAGRTGAIVPWTPSDRFNDLDRKYYGPLCLLLAGGAAASVRS
jgi:hypothetical protein